MKYLVQRQTDCYRAHLSFKQQAHLFSATGKSNGVSSSVCVGGNLGIVTSFTVKINSLDALPQVTTMQYSAGYDHAAELFDAVRFASPLLLNTSFFVDLLHAVWI